MGDFQDFIDALYEAGWKAPNDAQHTKIKKVFAQFCDQNPKPPADGVVYSVDMGSPGGDKSVLCARYPNGLMKFYELRDLDSPKPPAESDKKLRDEIRWKLCDEPHRTASGRCRLVYENGFDDGWEAARANPDPRVAELVEAAEKAGYENGYIDGMNDGKREGKS